MFNRLLFIFALKHPDFDTTKYTNDVSVILLDRDVTESDETGVICLDRKDSTKPGTRAYAVGWGSTSVSTKIGIYSKGTFFLTYIQLLYDLQGPD